MMSRILSIASLALICTACADTDDRPVPAKPEFLNSAAALERGLPFSEAVRAGDVLFLAGQIGVDPTSGQLVPGGVEPEARQALENIKSVLERNGRSLADVVKCTAFLADIGDWPRFNEIYKQYFKPPYPARSALGVNGLARNARLELECIAYAPRPQT